jgi:hypothetical protein
MVPVLAAAWHPDSPGDGSHTPFPRLSHAPSTMGSDECLYLCRRIQGAPSARSCPQGLSGAVPRSVVRVAGIQSGAAYATTWVLTVSILDDEPPQATKRHVHITDRFSAASTREPFTGRQSWKGLRILGLVRLSVPLSCSVVSRVWCTAPRIPASQADLENKIARRTVDHESVSGGRSCQAG